MRYGYAVRTAETKIPVLIRFTQGQVETFNPEAEGEWERTPLKDAILRGGGDFVWYDDISEAEAKRFMDQIRRLRK